MELKIVVRGLVYNPYKEELLFIRRADHNLIWEAPGGKLEPNETVEDAILREVKEEVGIKADIEKLAYAKVCGKLSNPSILMLMYILTTTDCDIKLSLEHSDYRWKHIDEVMDWEYLESYLKEEFIKYDIIEELNKISLKINDYE